MQVPISCRLKSNREEQPRKESAVRDAKYNEGDLFQTVWEREGGGQLKGGLGSGQGAAGRGKLGSGQGEALELGLTGLSLPNKERGRVFHWEGQFKPRHRGRK